MSIGWAILGTSGFPDEKVAPALNLADDCELIAVMSRDAARAKEFAASMTPRLVTTPLMQF